MQFSSLFHHQVIVTSDTLLCPFLLDSLLPSSSFLSSFLTQRAFSSFYSGSLSCNCIHSPIFFFDDGSHSMGTKELPVTRSESLLHLFSLYQDKQKPITTDRLFCSHLSFSCTHLSLFSCRHMVSKRVVFRSVQLVIIRRLSFIGHLIWRRVITKK